MVVSFKDHNDDSYAITSHTCVYSYSTKYGDIIVSVPTKAIDRGSFDDFVAEIFGAVGNFKIPK
jgi:hypothetical protein